MCDVITTVSDSGGEGFLSSVEIVNMTGIVAYLLSDWLRFQALTSVNIEIVAFYIGIYTSVSEEHSASMFRVLELLIFVLKSGFHLLPTYRVF